MPSNDDDDRLTRMFTKQLELQRRLGTDPTEVRYDERAQRIAEMLFAMTTEIGEVSNEIGWKPWASKRFVNDDAAFGELRDAFQFMINAMFMIYQVSPAELAQLLEVALDEKLVKNHARADTGYEGTEKCPGCRRALDEVSLSEIKGPVNTPHGAVTELVFCQCGASVDKHVAAPFLID